MLLFIAGVTPRISDVDIVSKTRSVTVLLTKESAFMTSSPVNICGQEQRNKARTITTTPNVCKYIFFDTFM